jgi:Carboxypeptidase regulatory-like domain
MTDRDKGLCCAIKGLKLADPGKVRHRTRIVMPEAAGSLLSLKSFMHAIAFRLHSRKFFMHEFHYAKEHVIARTFHKAFRLIKKYLPLRLLVAIALKAQQSSPSAQAWAGVVRTAAGEPVAGAKVTVFTSGAKKNPTAVTGTDGRFAIAELRLGPNRVSVQMPGRGRQGKW